MASEFDQRFSLDSSDRLLDEFGESVTYLAPGSSAITIDHAIISDVRIDEVETSEGREYRESLDVIIGTDVVQSNYSGITEPKENATVTIGSRAYNIDAIETRPGLATLMLVRNDKARYSRQNLRRRV